MDPVPPGAPTDLRALADELFGAGWADRPDDDRAPSTDDPGADDGYDVDDE